MDMSAPAEWQADMPGHAGGNSGCAAPVRVSAVTAWLATVLLTFIAIQGGMVFMSLRLCNRRMMVRRGLERRVVDDPRGIPRDRNNPLRETRRALGYWRTLSRWDVLRVDIERRQRGRRVP